MRASWRVIQVTAACCLRWLSWPVTSWPWFGFMPYGPCARWAPMSFWRRAGERRPTLPCSQNTPPLDASGSGLREQLLHPLGQIRRRPNRLPVLVNEGMSSEAGDEQFLAATNFVIEMDAKRGLFPEFRDDRQCIIIEGGTGVFDAKFYNGEVVALSLEFLVRQAAFLEQRRAAHLEPRQIVAMIDDAHHVGFGVADDDLGA